MNFEIKAVLSDGVEIKADGNYSGVAVSKMAEEDLARAALFFWRALVAHRIVAGQSSVDKALEETLVAGGQLQIDGAVKTGRNILVGQMEAKT